MKLNWGWGLTIFITIFLIAILSFVYFASTQQVNLVEKDYYPKGVTYQEQIQKQQNAKALPEKISITQSENTLTVIFPKQSFSQNTKGTLHFAHIENYKLDQELELELDSAGQQVVDASSFEAGRYKVKVDWETNETPFFQEMLLTIQ